MDFIWAVNFEINSTCVLLFNVNVTVDTCDRTNRVAFVEGLTLFSQTCNDDDINQLIIPGDVNTDLSASSSQNTIGYKFISKQSVSQTARLSILLGVKGVEPCHL